MFVRELDYMPFDVKSILNQAHKRSHNGHAWDVGADLVAPHTAHEAKFLSKEAITTLLIPLFIISLTQGGFLPE